MFIKNLLQLFKNKPKSTLSLEDLVYSFDRNRKVKFNFRNTGITYEGRGVLYENETEIRRFYAILNSMTKNEKCNPGVISEDRLKKIATGSGTNLDDIKFLIDIYNRWKMEISQSNSTI
ncbi:hypothetical protein [Paenibacillus periandrae]|uniref:hypothetical protein n=1 Tax=Paenibacillus periandrae TaxID=1761741 RepID=UPI001F09E808|nr:hypothetical protein [Paenibacillus periandrae]